MDIHLVGDKFNNLTIEQVMVNTVGLTAATTASVTEQDKS
jgi:hypothetical protein